MKATVILSNEQIESFHERGFLTIDAITTAAEVQTIGEIYDHLFSQRIGWDHGSQFDLAGTDEEGPAKLPQLLQPSLVAPQLESTLYRTNARALALQLLGPTLDEKCGEHMIYKPARYGAATPWHQDQAYSNPALSYCSVNFWLTLDDASIDSGCLQYVPGSHKLDVLNHHRINHDPRIHGLEVDDPEQWSSKAVACPVPAAGATLHAAYMLHYAGPNTTDRPRRAYTLVHRLPATKRDVPVDNYWQREKKTAGDARRQATLKAKG